MSEQPDYLVRGSDGQNYPADRATMWQWIREGRVSPSHVVYDSLAQRWGEARDFPDLREAFYTIGIQSLPPSGPSSVANSPNYVGRTIAVIAGVVLLAWLAHFLFSFLAALLLGFGAWFAASRRAKPISFIVGPQASFAGNVLLLGIAAVSLAVGGSVDGLKRYSGWQFEARTRREAMQIAERQKRDAERRTTALRANAATFSLKLSDDVRRLHALDAAGDVRKAHSELKIVASAAEPYMQLNPLPGELADVANSYTQTKKRIEAKFAIAKKIDDAKAGHKRAASLISSKDWLAADDAISEALAPIEGITVGEAQKIRVELTAMRKRIKAKADRARLKKQEKELYLALCGPEPYRSAWDGEVGNIESALRKVAHDPKSIDVENCTEPYLDPKRCWVTVCDVRGRNAFGGLILTRRTFSISKLGIEEVD